MSQSIIIPKGPQRIAMIERVVRFMHGLSDEHAWAFTFAEAKPKRSTPQNALLWALYGDIIQHGGEAMRGWDKDDLHDFFLIEHFGAEKVQIFGRTKLRPKVRSSKMNKQEFTDHIAFIVHFMNEHGVYLELPQQAAG